MLVDVCSWHSTPRAIASAVPYDFEHDARPAVVTRPQDRVGRNHKHVRHLILL
jgi:hypothetical protein